jgi:4-amino-4-deoxy-L-arabinose transferase-like glycosyltransferase
MRKPAQVICQTLLGALIAFSLINNLIWLRIDTRPPRWDEAFYLTMSLKYQACLFSGGMLGFIRCLLTLFPSRPPLVPALAVPAYLLLGRSTDAALTVNLIAFVFLVLAVYWLGARLGSPLSGLLAAFFISTYPGVFDFSRVFLFELVDASLVASCLYLMVRTEGFSNRGVCLAFGAVAGLGLLCRVFFPFFIIGPLAVCIYGAWKASQREIGIADPMRFHRRVNTGLALIVCALVAVPWYIVNFVPVVLRSFSAAYGEEAVGYGPSNPLSVHAILSYVITFTNVHTTLFGLLIFLLGVAILWANRSSLSSEGPMGAFKRHYGLPFLLLSLFIPLMIFATARAQDPKNILPVLPSIAVVSACGLLALKPSVLKKTLIGSAISISLFNYWIGTYGLRGLPPEVGLNVGSNLPAPLIYRQASANPEEGWHKPPMREDWRTAEILSRITGGSIDPAGLPIMVRPAVVAVVPDHPLFNQNNFEYFAVLRHLPIQVKHPGRPNSPRGKDFTTQLLGADFAVVKTGHPGHAMLNPYNTAMVNFLRSPESGFVEVPPRLPLPDGSQAILYAASEKPMLKHIPRMRFQTPVSFNDGVELLGYDLEEKPYTGSGRAFIATYYWRALREVANDYRVFVHVTEGAERRAVSGWDHAPARGRYPTSFWPPGSVIRDRGLYFLPDDLARGSYQMRVGLFLLSTGERLKVVRLARGLAADDGDTRVAIGTIEIR